MTHRVSKSEENEEINENSKFTKVDRWVCWTSRNQFPR